MGTEQHRETESHKASVWVSFTASTLQKESRGVACAALRSSSLRGWKGLWVKGEAAEDVNFRGVTSDQTWMTRRASSWLVSTTVEECGVFTELSFTAPRHNKPLAVNGLIFDSNAAHMNLRVN